MLKGEIFTHWGLTCLHKCVKQTTSTQVGFNKQHKLQNKLESNKETDKSSKDNVSKHKVTMHKENKAKAGGAARKK